MSKGVGKCDVITSQFEPEIDMFINCLSKKLNQIINNE